MTLQILATLPLERPLSEVAARPQRLIAAARDWTRDREGWRSADGWTIRRGHVNHPDCGGYDPAGNGWVAYAPDGLPEWWATDPVTAMVRAEGGV